MKIFLPQACYKLVNLNQCPWYKHACMKTNGLVKKHANGPRSGLWITYLWCCLPQCLPMDRSITMAALWRELVVSLNKTGLSTWKRSPVHLSFGIALGGGVKTRGYDHLDGTICFWWVWERLLFIKLTGY